MSPSTAMLRRLEADLGELLARHERARNLSEFERYADDPVGFMRDVLRWDPWRAQVEIAEAVRDTPLCVVRSANALGKDAVAARLALWWAVCRRGLALVTGPTERQVRNTVFGEIARSWTRAEDLPGELYATALRLGPEEQGGILGFVSTSTSRLTGFHAPRVFGVLTEAQGVEAFAWEGLLACATGSEDRILAVGNPLAPSGRFWSVSQPGSGWKAIGISAQEHPNLDPDSDRYIPGGPSKAFVERIAQEYGEDSGVYMARVLGEFPAESLYGLCRREWLDAAVARHEAGELAPSGEPIVAVDPARFGPDHTVLAVRRGPVLERLVAWAKADTMETVERIVEHAREAGVRPRAAEGEFRSVFVGRAPYGVVVVDEVGLGGGIADRLRELRYRTAMFNSARRAIDHKKHANRRAEAFWTLRKLLEEGEIAIPADDMLLEELAAIEWSVNMDGRVQIQPKDELRAELGRSTDRGDATAMAFSNEHRRHEWRTVRWRP